MRKSIKLILASGLAVLGLFAAPSAQATTGDAAPTPAVPSDAKAVCIVSGKVTTPLFTTPAGNQGAVGHSEYEFLQSDLNCQATPLGDASLSGIYNVTANGDSWGPLHAGFCTDTGGAPGACSGSSTAVSWSDDTNYAGRKAACDTGPTTNKGRITSTSTSSGIASDGFVKFVRGASETVAWGSFCSGSLNGLSFSSNMEFFPDPTTTPPPGKSIYNLVGVAVIY